MAVDRIAAEKPLLSRIAAGETILADGAMGTMLIASGLQSGQAPELLNLTQPELLARVHQQYLSAGAEIIQTNTFGANPLKLVAHGLAGKMAEINRAAGAIARRIVGNNGYVCGDCGPTGRLLKPYGDTEPALVFDCYLQQAKALIDAGVDLLNFETMMDLAEAIVAVKAAKTASSVVPVIASMTFEQRTRGFFTIMGNTIEQVAQELADAGADIIGSNCGNGSEAMVAIAQQFRQTSPLPLCIRPNAGMPVTEGDRLVYPESPEFMAAQVRRLKDEGVAIIGGCCGTTPEHIHAFRAALQVGIER